MMISNFLLNAVMDRLVPILQQTGQYLKGDELGQVHLLENHFAIPSPIDSAKTPT